MNRWWGYQHVNGKLQVKRFFDQRDIDEANESDFVQAIVYPFFAKDREDAMNFVRRQLL
jgi:hypothetical protein